MRKYLNTILGTCAILICMICNRVEDHLMLRMENCQRYLAEQENYPEENKKEKEYCETSLKAYQEIYSYLNIMKNKYK